MKNILLFLTTIFLLISCRSIVEEPTLEEPTFEEQHVGTWKLIRASFAGLLIHDIFGVFPPDIDFSQEDIIFEFKADSVLTVSGKMEQLDDWFSEQGLMGEWLWGMYSSFCIDEGTYVYIIAKETEHQGYLMIDNEQYETSVAYDKSEMRIGRNAFGGYLLNKVNE